MLNEEQLIQPPKVSIAVKLLYTTLGLMFIRYAIIATSLAGSSGSWLEWALFVGLTRFLLWGIIINRISVGKQWARIIFLFFILFNLPSEVRSILAITTDPISGLFGLIIIALEVTAVIFLFQKKSSEWFYTEKSLEDVNAQPDIQPDR